MDERKRKKLYFRRKKFLAVILTGLIFAYSAMNIYTFGEEYLEDIEHILNNVMAGRSTVSHGVEKLEDALSDDMYEKMKFIEAFSYVNVLLDKREISNFSYIKDETGSLHYASFYRDHDPDIFEYALRIERLEEYVNENGTDVLFVMAPSKYAPNDGRLRLGLPINDPHNNLNELMFYLNRLGVNTLDLNNFIPGDTVSYDDAFYKTDHHWTIDAAFYSTQLIADKLNADYGYDLDTEKYLSEDSYTRVRYENGMLGSMGRATGVCFSGLDDFTAYYPNYQMNFYRYYLDDDKDEFELEGDITQTLMNYEELYSSDDVYEISQYGLYLDELEVYEHIVNRDNPDGPRILFIRDSYFSPVITFMAPMCSEIDAIWNMDKSHTIVIDDYLKENTYDCIILEYYPYNIEDRGFSFFRETE